MQMLIVNCSPDVEDILVDALLETDGVTGFTVFKVQGHGPIGAMSIAEQVAGRRNRIEVHIALEQVFIKPCLTKLENALPNPDIMYWVMPILACGRLKDISASD